jgi:hypothetical protein
MGLSSVFKNKSGPKNPFAVPDLKYLLEKGRYGDESDPLGSTGGLYDSIISRLTGPSSTEGVRGEVNDETMAALLAAIDEDTDAAAGGAKMDFAERGLGGAGRMSDIEASALGGIRTNAAKNKGNTRLAFATDRLDRLDAREGQLLEAMGMKASTATNMLDALLGRKLTADTTHASTSASLWNAAENRKQAGKKRSWLGTVGDEFGQSFGRKLGENAAGGASNAFAALLGM